MAAGEVTTDNTAVVVAVSSSTAKTCTCATVCTGCLRGLELVQTTTVVVLGRDQGVYVLVELYWYTARTVTGCHTTATINETPESGDIHPILRPLLSMHLARAEEKYAPSKKNTSISRHPRPLARAGLRGNERRAVSRLIFGTHPCGTSCHLD